jgi:hypothetical protein
MTQDEVDLIYDYLHENYEYRDGELITTKNISNAKKTGSSIGCFTHYYHNKSPVISTNIKVNGINYYFAVSHLIYLYHNKLKPKIIKFKDSNIANTRIENLISISQTEFNNSLRAKKCCYFHEGRWKVRFFLNRKAVSMGGYKTQEEAQKIYNLCLELIDNGIYEESEIKKIIKEFNPRIKINVTNKYGFPGIMKSRNKYYARVRFKKIESTLGGFDTPEEAHAAYLKAKEDYKNEMVLTKNS